MIADNLQKILSTVRPGVRLVAVSKYQPIEALQEAYDTGQRVFGESHVQELVAKEQALPKDIEWHFIGHLQTNKVKYMASFVSLIHAVDSVKLLREIDRQAARTGRMIRCLLQIHVAQEDSKYGFAADELREMLKEGGWRQLHHVQLCGLMCMASNTDDEEQIAAEFTLVCNLFHEIKEEYFPSDECFRELSMGMSGDYMIAQQCGSTMVRIGSLIFGERQYQ